MVDIERKLIWQRQRIQRIHQVHFGFDSLEPQFSDELQAFCNKRRGWTTRALYRDLEQEHQFNEQQTPLGNPEPGQTSHIHHPSTSQQQTEEHLTQSQPHTSLNHTDHPHSTNPSSNTITQSDLEHATLNSATFSVS